MTRESLQAEWERYVREEVAWCTPFLTQHGYRLDETQIHTLGERYLMLTQRDVGGGGLKLILTGTHTDGTKVIIKVSRDRGGIEEIDREHTARVTISKLPFSYQLLTPPEDLLHERYGDGVISIAKFIPQDKPFIERPTEEQFSLALSMFKMQESVHAATYEHAQNIATTFGIRDSRWYLKQALHFADHILDDARAPIKDVLYELEHSRERIEQYCGFLTHADFVPHNFRIHDGVTYLIDYASIHFGNKHESWGRFMNFMMLYNPELNRALTVYLTQNRSAEEIESVRLMRLYKNLYLLSYYADTLPQTAGSMRTLTEARIIFWSKALEALRSGTELSNSTIESYTKLRDSLRDSGEQARQKGLH